MNSCESIIWNSNEKSYYAIECNQRFHSYLLHPLEVLSTSLSCSIITFRTNYFLSSYIHQSVHIFVSAIYFNFEKWKSVFCWKWLHDITDLETSPWVDPKLYQRFNSLTLIPIKCTLLWKILHLKRHSKIWISQ